MGRKKKRLKLLKRLEEQAKAAEAVPQSLPVAAAPAPQSAPKKKRTWGKSKATNKE